MRKVSGIFAAAALVASVALVGPAANAAETITGSGSSYMNAIQATCAAAYTTDKVTYTAKGSGTGKSEFAKGVTDFGGTDSLYAEGAQPANFTYVPLVGGPIGVLINVPGLTTINLTPKLVSDIFTGKITTWNNKAIAAVNKSIAKKLPAETIQVTYRSDGSGTTYNFSNFLEQVVGKPWTPSDTWATASAGAKGTGGNKSSGLIASMKSLPYSIGYADLADAATAGLEFAAIKNGAGQFVKPDVRTAKAFLAVQRVASNGIVTYDYKTPVRGAYPVSLISYALAYKNGNTVVQNYLKAFVSTCAPAEAAKLSYVAIDGKLKKTALDLIDLIG